jgi:prepilin-type N-terminal cleavage/methylation domain-containing protein
MSRRVFRGGSESGLTLIELMVSLVVLAIASSFIVAGLIATMQTTRSSRNRLQASSLASREMEILRNEFNSSPTAALAIGAANQVTNPHPLPGGTAGAALSIDGSPYTVVRNVEWLPAGTGKSACDGTAALTYPSLAVNVSVTWPRMGGVKPVVSNTVLTPPKNTLASSTSFVAVKVANVTNTPLASQVVTLTGPGGTYTDTTATDGCAVFALSSTGTYTASVNTAGYVDSIGNTNPSQSVTVAAGTLSQRSFGYDQAGTLAVTLTTDSGYALPTTLPQISLYNTTILPLGVKALASSAATTSISNLWPYVDGYAVWAGSCKQSDPVVSGGTRDAVVPLAAGASLATSVRLAPVQVNVTTIVAGLPVSLVGATVLATPLTATNCAVPDTQLTLGVTNALGVLMTSLPAGKWTLTVKLKTGSTLTNTLLQTTAASSYALPVS